MKMKTLVILIALTAFSTMAWGQEAGSVFSYDNKRIIEAKPWTDKKFQKDPEEFQFLIIGDRTGGANQQGTFKLAMNQINLLQPEFVINVGDLIEGYSDVKAELNAEWDEIDTMLNTLDMPFFRTPGNHDIANLVAQQVWKDRYGTTYYHFVYKDTLFVVLDTEELPREAPKGMKEKIELYNRLQVEDPAKAQAMLDEFMSDEAVVAALAKTVEFSTEQISFLKKNSGVRWTVLFMHEPCWKNPSKSFKEITKLLTGRKHTFFAGHLHYYDYDNIDGVEYITMGPAGASFHHEGPGNVDHITWVTMTKSGPQIGNIALKGVFDRKGLDPERFGAYDRNGGGKKVEPKKEE